MKQQTISTHAIRPKLGKDLKEAIENLNREKKSKAGGSVLVHVALLLTRSDSPSNRKASGHRAF